MAFWPDGAEEILFQTDILGCARARVQVLKLADLYTVFPSGTCRLIWARLLLNHLNSTALLTSQPMPSMQNVSV
jgi:hypothetical protein